MKVYEIDIDTNYLSEVWLGEGTARVQRMSRNRIMADKQTREKSREMNNSRKTKDK